MLKNNYSDGFFSVDIKNGFLPIKHPLKKLPERYNEIQELTDKIPVLISSIEEMSRFVLQLPNFSKEVKKEEDVFVIQALYRAYSFITSAYLLTPSHVNMKNGIYAKAHTILPSNIAIPYTIVSNKLDVYPWLDYHYAYSLGNYVMKEEDNYHWNNLKMSCSFSGTNDEIGFIMNHVYINAKSPDLIKSAHRIFNANDYRDGLGLLYETLKEMNERRRTMWSASNPHNYNNFRAFIMGIKDNHKIFGDGVIYEGVSAEPKTYRGQTGAQDDIIPTADLITGITSYYPENMLSKYLMDLRSYRPKCVQDFFKDLEKTPNLFKLFKEKEDFESLQYLLACIEQIYFFRNGHWQFVQQYIMKNTRYAQATGGTPITSWLPNQIEAVLKAMDDIISYLNNYKITEELEIFMNIKKSQKNKVEVLNKQLEELKNKNYNIERIYNLNITNNIEDITL